MAGKSQLRSIDGLIGPAIRESVNELELGTEYLAAVRLARTYADLIDANKDAETLKELGPKLLAVLDSLGATPKGRAALSKGRSDGGSTAPVGRLTAYRDKHAG
jgi:hypothetical protein